MNSVPTKNKVGPITLALGFVALGVGMLAYNFGLVPSVATFLKLWPLLLIGLGVEYFFRRFTHKEGDVRFSVASTILIGCMAFTMAAAGWATSLNLYDFISGRYWEDNYRHSSQWESGPVKIDKDSSIQIENPLGKIELSQSVDDSLHIKANIRTRRAWEENSPGDRLISIEPGKITRVLVKDNLPGENLAGVDMRVEIPRGVNVKVTNKLGEVIAEDLEGNISAITDLGKIEINRVKGDITAESKAGAVEISHIQGNIEASAELGKISIENPQNNVNARTKAGSIELSSDLPLDKNYNLQTDLGEIVFRLPGNSNIEVQARTQHGSIRGFPSSAAGQNSPGAVRTTKLGQGKGMAQLTTQNGSIVLETR